MKGPIWLVDNQKPQKSSFQNLYELHQMSKQFKLISENTKIVFVRNRIPRALIKSRSKTKSIVDSTRRWLLCNRHGQPEKNA